METLTLTVRRYAATLDHKGELIVATADMEVFTAVTPDYVLQKNILDKIVSALL